MSGSELKELEKYGRITLYAAQKERKELLKKLLKCTNANNLSEAVFQALSFYVEQADKKFKNDLLTRSKGMWADNPEIDQALNELERGWEEWRNKS